MTIYLLIMIIIIILLDKCIDSDNYYHYKRNKLRKRNQSIKGLKLTETLDKYAQTGKEYTDILEQIIKQNDLSDFEKVQLTNSVVKKDIQL